MRQHFSFDPATTNPNAISRDVKLKLREIMEEIYRGTFKESIWTSTTTYPVMLAKSEPLQGK